MKVILKLAGFAVLAVVVGTAGLFGIEIVLAMQGKREPPFVNPSHEPIRIGNDGLPLIYVVLGDSTAAGRGAPYADGIAMNTAEHLAHQYKVVMTNFSVSGAVAADVVRDQLMPAAHLRPDIVLLSVGANDATHFTSSAALQGQLDTIIDTLRRGNPDVKIVVTGSPQMGSIPRFLQPLRWFAGTQTDRINAVFAHVVSQKHVIWAHIADRTGEAFKKDPTLFADDKFHPNSRGYAVWIPVLNEALDRAFANSPPQK